MVRPLLIAAIGLLSSSAAMAQEPGEPGSATAVAYMRASAALEERHRREEDAEEQRCESRLAPTRGARIRAAAASGNPESVRGAFQSSCAAEREMMRARHLAEWMEFEEAYRRGRELPDIENDNDPIEESGEEEEEADRDAAEEARERKELEDKLNEERDRLGEFLRSRDEYGSNNALQEDIRDAYARVEQAENNYVDHLRRHSPREADAYLQERWEIRTRPFRSMGDIQDRIQAQRP